MIEFDTGGDTLAVYSSIYFDETWRFCRMPYVSLYVHRDKMGQLDSNTICISVNDYDDFDISLFYLTDEEHFFDVVHELINWMIDHEKRG